MCFIWKKHKPILYTQEKKKTWNYFSVDLNWRWKVIHLKLILGLHSWVDSFKLKPYLIYFVLIEFHWTAFELNQTYVHTLLVRSMWSHRIAHVAGLSICSCNYTDLMWSFTFLFVHPFSFLLLLFRRTKVKSAVDWNKCIVEKVKHFYFMAWNSCIVLAQGGEMIGKVTMKENYDGEKEKGWLRYT